MKIKNEETKEQFEPTKEGLDSIKMAFENGDIRDGCWDVLSWNDCIDGSGNMELDENAFDDCKHYAFVKEGKV